MVSSPVKLVLAVMHPCKDGDAPLSVFWCILCHSLVCSGFSVHFLDFLLNRWSSLLGILEDSILFFPEAIAKQEFLRTALRVMNGLRFVGFISKQSARSSVCVSTWSIGNQIGTLVS